MSTNRDLCQYPRVGQWPSSIAHWPSLTYLYSEGPSQKISVLDHLHVVTFDTVSTVTFTLRVALYFEITKIVRYVLFLHTGREIK